MPPVPGTDLKDLRPPHRKCVGCGYCCRKATCALGAVHFSRHSSGPKESLSPCPYLVRLYGRSWCGLLLSASEEVRKDIEDGALFVGAGCCSPLNTERSKLLSLRLEGR